MEEGREYKRDPIDHVGLKEAFEVQEQIGWKEAGRPEQILSVAGILKVS